jgi:hypothetical protein
MNHAAEFQERYAMKTHGSDRRRDATPGLKLMAAALGLAAVGYMTLFHDDAPSLRAQTPAHALAHAAEPTVDDPGAADASSPGRESSGFAPVGDPMEQIDVSRECRRDSGIDTHCIFH